jgi:hypothetical protein
MNTQACPPALNHISCRRPTGRADLYCVPPHLHISTSIFPLEWRARKSTPGTFSFIHLGSTVKAGKCVALTGSEKVKGPFFDQYLNPTVKGSIRSYRLGSHSLGIADIMSWDLFPVQAVAVGTDAHVAVNPVTPHQFDWFACRCDLHALLGVKTQV